MVEQIPTAITKRYVLCPHCGKGKSEVDHLLDKHTSTRWYCDDCGRGYSLKFEGGKMYVAKNSNTSIRCMVALRRGDVLLVVEGLNMNEGSSDTSLEEHHEYFYNEHTCPTNYMRRIIEVGHIHDDDYVVFDEHGIFKYVGEIPCDDYMKIRKIGSPMDDVATGDAIEAWIKNGGLK